METRKYGLFVKTPLSYEDVLARTKAALKEQGFGVLTEIDVKATMQEKLGVEFRHYDIIGACNPPLAHRALSTELDIGLLLPCNVVVYEDNDGTTVGALDPGAMMGFTGNDALVPVAAEAKERLQKALSSLEMED
ncbi:MAG: DUF302 domain-containing protein [Dehalococcoidia bacterium]